MMGLTLKTKKRLTNVAQSIFFLFGGIEYAVVLPTLNEYLGHLDGNATFFGIVMAAFSFSGVFVSPLFGLIQDRFHKTKNLILFANLWEIGGNFLYFVGGSKYMLLGSRLISGVGAGVGSSIFAQISRTSSEKERASALSTASAARQIGLLLGPALNLPLNSCNFYIGRFHVNKFSGPGILMCMLFIILEFITFFLFYDIPPLDKQDAILAAEKRAANPPTVVNIQESINGEYDDGPVYNSYITENDSENRSQRLHGGRVSQFDSYQHNPNSKEDDRSNVTNKNGGSDEIKTFSKLDVFLKEEVLVLLMAQFVFLFNQTCLETGLTVMTKNLLDFGGVENSILYAVAGAELLVSFIIIKFVSRCVSDRTMLISSLTFEIIPYIMLLIFYPNASPGRARNMWWFVTLFVVQVSGLAFLAISIISLFSKVTPPAMQGIAQGVRRAVGGIGTIMGPLWAGGMQDFPFETLAIMMALFILSLGMGLMSWKLLRPHSTIAAESIQTQASENTNEESKPLLVTGSTADYGVA